MPRRLSQEISLTDERAIQLARRLGIKPRPSEGPILLWAKIGLQLAKRQPEFREDRGRPLEWDDRALYQLLIDILETNDWTKPLSSGPKLAHKLCQKHPQRYGKYLSKIPTFAKYVWSWRKTAGGIALYAFQRSKKPDWEAEVRRWLWKAHLEEEAEKNIDQQIPRKK
jgi:hypothetical protein